MVINGTRELAYVVKITDILPVQGADRLVNARMMFVNDGVECPMMWNALVSKGEFEIGDYGVYFETDSKLPEEAPFTEMSFVVKNHYKIKKMKFNKFGGIVSDGLLVPVKELGLTDDEVKDGAVMTQRFKVTYSDPDDVQRKTVSEPGDKYKKMSQRNPKLARTWWWRFLYKFGLGKNILFAIFGKNSVNSRTFPKWDGANGEPLLRPTDEERIQNQGWRFAERDIRGNKIKYVATEKIDGSSSTFALRKVRGKYDYYVCSRNIVKNRPGAGKGYYDTDIWSEIDEKYGMEDIEKKFLADHPEIDWVAIQGEIFGAGVQKRDYGMKDRDIRIFNLIDNVHGRWGSIEGKAELEKYGLTWVPILDECYELPDTFDELMAYSGSEVSKIDGGMREGVVFREIDLEHPENNGKDSFKCVDDNYLLKYHG